MAISAASLMRPGWTLLRVVDEKRVNVIVAEDTSRLTRDQADAHTLFKKLAYAEVRLVTIADGINTADRSAKLTYALKSMVAEVYLDDLRDKTRRGMQGRGRERLRHRGNAVRVPHTAGARRAR